MVRSMGTYLWMLIRGSFHGTIRVLEIGEAVVAMFVHVAGWFWPEHKEELEVLFVVLVGLLILTFLVGLFLAAFASQCEEQDKRLEAERLLAEDRTARAAERQANSPDTQKEAAIHTQIANLGRSELLALKQLVIHGPMNEGQLVEFCRANGLEVVTPGMLEKRVGFLTRDPVTAIWLVTPLMDVAARKVLAQVEV